MEERIVLTNRDSRCRIEALQNIRDSVIAGSQRVGLHELRAFKLYSARDYDGVAVSVLNESKLRLLQRCAWLVMRHFPYRLRRIRQNGAPFSQSLVVGEECRRGEVLQRAADAGDSKSCARVRS